MLDLLTSEIWSKKKTINICVNIMVFLVAINFMHYGQLFLPVICLILLVENQFHIKVNDISVFIALCIFAITFFIFSYSLGFYSVMGFCIPMAYYIGSNIYEINEQKVINVIYIIVFGMAAHMALNMLYEFVIFEFNFKYMFSKPKHYDIWTWEMARTTGTALNCVGITGAFYYLIKCERVKDIKYIGVFLFFMCHIYNLALGKRSVLIVLLVSFLFAYSYDNHSKNKNLIINKKNQYIAILCMLVLSVVLYFSYPTIKGLTIVKKISSGFENDRLVIFLKYIKLMPKFLLGGMKMSNELGSVPHDLFGDVYDYGGILPYIAIIYWFVKNMIIIFKNRSNNMLAMTVIFAMSIMMFVEPIMSGASIYLICYVIITTMLCTF